MQVLSSGTVRLDPEKFAKELGRHGLSGERLSELSGMTETTISAARNGKPIRLSTMRKLVQVVLSQPVIDGADMLA
jgi:transcriptional regulator with XRE-family HTH domain